MLTDAREELIGMVAGLLNDRGMLVDRTRWGTQRVDLVTLRAVILLDRINHTIDEIQERIEQEDLRVGGEEFQGGES